MKDIFQLRLTDRPVRAQNTNNLKVETRKTVAFGTNSISSLGPKIWNNLPYHLKCTESLAVFKQIIKKWDGNKSSYETLLSKTDKNFMSINRVRTLCIEIFKTINNLNPPFMKDIFQLRLTDRPVRAQNTNNLKVETRKNCCFWNK